MSTTIDFVHGLASIKSLVSLASFCFTGHAMGHWSRGKTQASCGCCPELGDERRTGSTGKASVYSESWPNLRLQPEGQASPTTA
jgi:hypothetical protein